MRRILLPVLGLLTVLPLHATTCPVTGTSSTSPAVVTSFCTAYSNGAFSTLVAGVSGGIQSLGSPGLVQEFQPVGGNAKYALVDPDPNGANMTYQVYGDIYSLYSQTATFTAAGYPTGNTQTCPSNSHGACNYQIFANGYAIFGYTSPSAVTFALSGAIYTEWNSGGGSNGPAGVPIAAAGSVTSYAGTAGTQQVFLNGAIYSYPASSTTPSAYTVAGAIYTAYQGAGGYGNVGFPTSEETVLASGIHQQTFEDGMIQWNPATPATPATVMLAIGQLEITGATSGLTLNVGSSATLGVTLFDIHGALTSGWPVSWSTSNSSVVSIKASGSTAVVQGVSGGTANIYVTGGGKTSAAFLVVVNSNCCAIGQGAPTPAITQAFQAAVTRNHLTPTLPNATAVAQVGSGYVQTFGAFAIGEANGSATAYVVGGSLYAAYVANGGFAGPLGYPVSDASAGGTQTFASGAALAGSPVQVVPVPIAAKWLASGAETGSLGVPTAAASTFTSLSGINGNSQIFTNGSIYGIASGAMAGQAFMMAGPILARYLVLSGPTGTLGVPTSDPFLKGAVLTQNFETGYIDLQPGASVAVEHYNPRTPALTATPASAVPGGTVHIGLSGFAFGAMLTVSITGQPNFTVTVPGGEYSWNLVVPANARAGLVTIQATATGSTDSATGSYTVTSLPLLRPTLSAVSGDQQTGLPGSTLASPLVAVLRDLNGNPLPGVPVLYTASPGASSQGSAVTDANGMIAASLRLPPASGVAGLTVAAAGRVVTFSALATANSLQNFPSVAAPDAHSSLAAALAAEIAWYQSQGTLGIPNGTATPANLIHFLSANGGYTLSETGASIANPWIATQFVGVSGGVSVETPTNNRVADLLNAGSPVILALSLEQDGAPIGGTAVVATGVNADGSFAIMDPNPAYGQVSLNAYLGGFGAQGHTIQGVVSGAMRIVPAAATPNGFVLSSQLSAGAAVVSPAGSCPSIDLLDQPGSGGARFIGCDGTQSAYQASFVSQKGAAVADLAAQPVSSQTIAANSGAAFQIARVSGALTITSQTTTIGSVVNAAGYGPGLSPGGLFSIFGSGLANGTVTINGQVATVLAAFPFQINAQVPPGAAAGAGMVQVAAPLGTASQPVTILPSAPGIFVIGPNQAAVVNQDGTLNTPANPAARGAYISIYGTGLGATVAQGGFQTAVSPVTVSINGATLKPQFAGLSPGVVGLYQVNVQIPAGQPPGSSVALAIGAGGQTSNPVMFAVE